MMYGKSLDRIMKTSKMINEGVFYNADCLDILSNKDDIADESVDLIYLDPPFSTNRSYTMNLEGEKAVAFNDTWTWDNVGAKNLWFADIPPECSDIIFIAGKNENWKDGKNCLSAYLFYMTKRLIPMKRVLKDTGSIYLHCDPMASHYLKMLMDVIFGRENFRNEIVWHYRRWTASSRDFQRMHDVIFRYGKTINFSFNPQHEPYGAWIKKDYGYIDDETGKRWRWHTVKGKRYKVFLEDENKGVKLNDVWNIPYLGSTSKERTGYPTQKPLALLERIIKASSNEGDVIFDPFCGCGTSLEAAETLNRKWIGIDKSPIALDIIKTRLSNNFNKGDRR